MEVFKVTDSQKILVSKIERIGIVHLQGVEKYLEKYQPKKIFHPDNCRNAANYDGQY